MRDFKLQNITGDLDLSNGDLQIQDGLDCIAQLIGTRFRFQKGEWFLDLRVGAPIFDDGSGFAMIGSNRNNLDQIRSIATQILDTTPGVLKVLSLVIDLDPNRVLTIKWSVMGDSGQVIAGAETLRFEDNL